jgi:hypothetical protein
VAEASYLVGGEVDEMLTGERDGVGDRRREEATRRRGEDAVERVHEDLDRLGRERVAGAAGAVTLGPQVRHQLWENPRLAPEGRAARCPDQVRARCHRVGAT